MKIAVQKSGRLTDLSLDYLKAKGFEFPTSDELVVDSKCGKAQLLKIRDDDIPAYVSRGVADFGIVGKNSLLEKKERLKWVEEMDFAKCRVVIAVPEDSGLNCVEDLEGLRIATSYPGITRTYLKELGVCAAVIEVKGSVESAPELGLCDAVSELTQTGRTLKEHKLLEIAEVLQSSAVLVSFKFNSL